MVRILEWVRSTLGGRRRRWDSGHRIRDLSFAAVCSNDREADEAAVLQIGSNDRVRFIAMRMFQEGGMQSFSEFGSKTLLTKERLINAFGCADVAA